MAKLRKSTDATFAIALVFLSGISALIYQTVWQKYLSILLGAHARASSIVLAVFLGGMSWGYSYFGRYTKKKNRNFVKTYAYVEFLIAIWAIFFPLLFRGALLSVGTLYGFFGISNILVDVLVSSLLLLFPSFLMGSTLPLLTQALSTSLTDSTRIHSSIYASNTLGAVVGCLLAGFFLIPETTFSTSLITAASLNIMTGILFYLRFSKVPEESLASEISNESVSRKKHNLLISISLLSGLVILTLETVLIRLVGLSVGSSSFNFAIVVSLFILGLALGGFGVTKMKLPSINTLIRASSLASILFVTLYLSVGQWSYFAHVLRTALKEVPQAFYLYQFLLFLLFGLILIIPVAIAGTILPLTFHLIKETKEAIGNTVGKLYSANTLGCIIGTIVGGHLLLKYLDLDQVFQICIVLSVIIALLSLLIALETRTFRSLIPSSIPSFIVLIAVIFLPLFPKERWIQPFRNQEQLEVTLKGAQAFGKHLSRSTRVYHWKDGPNTSLGIGVTPVEGNEESRTILVNGKSDGNTRGDFFTTVMLAHIPALLTPNIEKACVIGFGTGITIGTLGLYQENTSIDVLEISDTIIKNAFQFDGYNGGVSKNPKVHFHEMDAFRHFVGSKSQYDIIISEPSNPWVQGIENLYSTEFYTLAKSRLTEKGTFAQWIHTYSFSDPIFKMVLSSLQSVFPYVSIYQLKGGDLALIARNSLSGLEVLGPMLKRMNEKAVQTTLDVAGMHLPEAVLALELSPPSHTFKMASGSPVHSITSPRLSTLSQKAFFLRTNANVQELRRQSREWPTSLPNSLFQQLTRRVPFTPISLSILRRSFCDAPNSKNTTLCEEFVYLSRLQDPQFNPLKEYGDVLPNRDLASLAGSPLTLKGGKFERESLTKLYQFFETYKKYASPITYIPVENLVSTLKLCRNQISRTEELYGECILQELLIYDWSGTMENEFKKLTSLYFDWFKKANVNSTQYSKFKEAKDILEKMLRD